MRLFFSAGEPSGDLHGANLVRSIALREPKVEIVGYGGERMAEAGAHLLYPLCNLSVMGFRRIADHFSTFLKLIRIADSCFRRLLPPDDDGGRRQQRKSPEHWFPSRTDRALQSILQDACLRASSADRR